MVLKTTVRRVAGSAVAAVIFLSTLVLTASPASAFPVYTDMYIRNLNTAKCLEVVDSSSANGARAQQWEWAGQQGALWAVFNHGGGNYALRNKASWKLPEIVDSRTDNGAHAQQWSYDPSVWNTQHWFF